MTAWQDTIADHEATRRRHRRRIERLRRRIDRRVSVARERVLRIARIARWLRRRPAVAIIVALSGAVAMGLARTERNDGAMEEQHRANNGEP